MKHQPLDLPDPFTVRVVETPNGVQPGAGPFSAYAETFWLGIVGPTPFVLARRLVSSQRPWDKGLLAGCIGVGYKDGSMLERSLSRLSYFHLVAAIDQVLVVQSSWGRVSPRLLRFLPPTVAAVEDEFARRTWGGACTSAPSPASG